MSIEATAITERWERIRRRPECDLSLTPISVAEYLSIPESTLVRDRILESLIQFANRRIEKGAIKFVSTDPPTTGDMVTCEGLEAFLIPAVEGALPFSQFLESYEAKGGDKDGFVKAIQKDVEGLLENWEKGLFSGEPYAEIKKIKESIDPGIQAQFAHINITESAALACRVLIHLLTLKLNRKDEVLFQREIGDELVEERLFKALSMAIDFLVRAFQKGDGATEEEQIVNAKVGAHAGSGWSWTDRDGLPPMLFFTAAAVDAFAELDLYLIRPVIKREWVGDGLKLAVFYEQKENKEKLQHFQLCVDMARRWVQQAVLPFLVRGFGQYPERFPQGKSWEYLSYSDPKGYEQYTEDLNRWRERGLDQPPIVLYNSLYALLILLWSWGDQNDTGELVDDDSKSKINRAISQLVYNYSSIPVVQEILNRFKYIFHLPGGDMCLPNTEKQREYLDSAFLQLLTRLLVLFVVYGVGDRNMLEPIIRNLYVELLQNRHRGEIQYSALWSTKEIEVFSTQRAVQALTFYYAYAGGKEIVEEKGGSGGIVLRNRTGVPLILEAIFEGPVAIPDTTPAAGATVSPAPTDVQPPEDSAGIAATNFYEYCEQQDPEWHMAQLVEDGEAHALQNSARRLGEEIISGYNSRKVRNTGAVRLILNSIMNITASPESKDGVRFAELTQLRRQYDDLTGWSEADGNS